MIFLLLIMEKCETDKGVTQEQQNFLMESNYYPSKRPLIIYYNLKKINIELGDMKQIKLLKLPTKSNFFSFFFSNPLITLQQQNLLRKMLNLEENLKKISHEKPDYTCIISNINYFIQNLEKNIQNPREDKQITEREKRDVTDNPGTLDNKEIDVLVGNLLIAQNTQNYNKLYEISFQIKELICNNEFSVLEKILKSIFVLFDIAPINTRTSKNALNRALIAKNLYDFSHTSLNLSLKRKECKSTDPIYKLTKKQSDNILLEGYYDDSKWSLLTLEEKINLGFFEEDNNPPSPVIGHQKTNTLPPPISLPQTPEISSPAPPPPILQQPQPSLPSLPIINPQIPNLSTEKNYPNPPPLSSPNGVEPNPMGIPYHPPPQHKDKLTPSQNVIPSLPVIQNEKTSNKRKHTQDDLITESDLNTNEMKKKFKDQSCSNLKKLINTFEKNSPQREKIHQRYENMDCSDTNLKSSFQLEFNPLSTFNLQDIFDKLYINLEAGLINSNQISDEINQLESIIDSIVNEIEKIKTLQTMSLDSPLKNCDELTQKPLAIIEQKMYTPLEKKHNLFMIEPIIHCRPDLCLKLDDENFVCDKIPPTIFCKVKGLSINPNIILCDKFTSAPPPCLKESPLSNCNYRISTRPTTQNLALPITYDCEKEGYCFFKSKKGEIIGTSFMSDNKYTPQFQGYLKKIISYLQPLAETSKTIIALILGALAFTAEALIFTVRLTIYLYRYFSKNGKKKRLRRTTSKRIQKRKKYKIKFVTDKNEVQIHEQQPLNLE